MQIQKHDLIIAFDEMSEVLEDIQEFSDRELASKDIRDCMSQRLENGLNAIGKYIKNNKKMSYT